MRRPAWVAALAVLVVGFFTGESARAAFELFADDPSTIGRAATGPAWPRDEPGPNGGPLFGPATPRGLTLHSVRVSAVPGLAANGFLIWTGRRKAVVSAGARRLTLDGYSEVEFSASITRPRDGAGWGWFAATRYRRWAGLGRARGGSSIVAGLGYAPSTTFRAAVRAAEDRDASGTVGFSASFDPAPGWRLGAGYRAARPGGLRRLTVGVECRPGGGVLLQAGLEPTAGAVSLGLALDRGALRAATARRVHPRTGAASIGLLSIVKRPAPSTGAS